MVTFSEYLKKALAESGMSQRAAARKIGISAPSLNRMLKGRDYPNEKKLVKICFHLWMEVTMAWALIQHEKTNLLDVKGFLRRSLDGEAPARNEVRLTKR